MPPDTFGRHILLFLRKSSRITASAAEFFCGAAAGEAVIDRAGAGGGKDCVKLLREEIAERQNAVGVKTAGNNSAVNEYANLIAQTVAERIGI